MSNHREESLRVGVNPEGAYSVKMVDGDGKELAQDLKLDDIKCSRKSEACWTCQARSTLQKYF